MPGNHLGEAGECGQKEVESNGAREFPPLWKKTKVTVDFGGIGTTSRGSVERFKSEP